MLPRSGHSIHRSRVGRSARVIQQASGRRPGCRETPRAFLADARGVSCRRPRRFLQTPAAFLADARGVSRERKARGLAQLRGVALNRWTRAPLFHFLALGLVLFFADRLFFPVVSPEFRPVLTVSREQISRLAERARRSTGRTATATELDANIRVWIDDELLVREARARNWHRSDPVVQRRLIKNMRFLEDAGDPASDATLLARAHALEMDQTDEVVRRRLVQRMRLTLAGAATRDEPTNAELARRFDADPEKFRRPDRVRLTQIHLSRDRHGNALEDRAMALLEDLTRESIPPGAAAERGDPFLLPADVPPASPRTLEARFGPEFAKRVMTLPLQRWSGPVRSAYGLHLIWIHERERGAVPGWREVERELRSEWRADTEARALRRALRILREATEIRIEPGASAPDAIPNA